MKNAIFLSSMLLISGTCASQSVIGSFGGEGVAGAMNINYTAGEAFIATLDSSDNLVLTQGFHQPSYTIVAIEETFPPGTIQVFPNPASSVVEVHFKDVAIENISISMWDLAGRNIVVASPTSNVWHTDLSRLPEAFYRLTITDVKNGKTSSFNILKFN